jgi:adenylate cyclase
VRNNPAAKPSPRKRRFAKFTEALKARRKPRFKLARWFGVRRTTGFLLLAALLALRVVDPPALENLRLRAFDRYQIAKPRVSTLRPVVIVDIDEESLRALGQWPWPRTLVAELVEKLKGYGAVAIGFDILFPETDRMSPVSAVESFRGVDEETKAKLRALPSNDEVLAAAIGNARVVLGQSGILAPTSHATDLPQTGIAAMGPDPAPFLYGYPGLLRNVPVLEKAAAGRGLLTIRNERDGVVRRLPLVVKAGEIIAPALTLDMLRVVTKSGAVLVRTDAAGLKSVAIPGLEIPTDRNGLFWIHFGSHDPARYVSAKDVIEGRVPADRFKGRLVLIGTSAVGLLDIKTTPLDAAIPGVEIHAQVLENVLTKTVLSHPSWAPLVELAAVFAIGTTIVVAAPMMTAGTLLAVSATLAAILAAGFWYAFDKHSLLLDFSFPLLATFMLYVTLMFIGYLREQKDRRRIRSAFGQYLSPTLVEQLAQSPEKLVLGGEERVMTIMFSDVRGFTTISESFKHDPQGLTQLMNRFLTPLTNAIIENRGTIDKYMGDAVMAFWNAPIDDPEHEINACRAALDMIRRVEALNRERQQEAQAAGTTFIPIHIGVGINTGRCVVGNMGSDLRFDYSVLGDPVNLASRIEGRSKTYGTPIILGEQTARKVKGQFAAIEIDLIAVKGKTEPERIHAMLGAADVARRPDFLVMQERSAAMLAAYRRQDWVGALKALDECRPALDSFGLGEICKLYSARIETFRQEPPPEGWDGVFVAENK